MSPCGHIEDIHPEPCRGAYADVWKDGVFPKDPDLKQFLMSGPAILAALQIQNAFEMQYSKADCERLIEDYAYWGGDRGLTEQTMREACGMPPRDVRNVMSRAAAVIVRARSRKQSIQMQSGGGSLKL